MTNSYIAIGCMPISEPSFFENEDWNKKYDKKVLTTYVDQLKRMFPLQAHDITIIDDEVIGFTAVVLFEEGNENSFERAKNIAEELPYCWDDKSKEALGKQYFTDTLKLQCN